MTTSLNHSIFPKYALKTIRLFSKLLVPEGYRQFTSTNFRLQFVYISPVFYTKNKSPKAQGYCCIGEKGDFVILDTTPDNKLIDKFDQNSYTGMVDEEHILFYQNDMTPVIKLEFPTPDNANDAFIFSITPPEPGLMHIISFLHSFSAVSQQQRLFGNSSLPKIFKTEVQKVIETPTMELLLYAFATPQKISKINEKTIDFFISALGDKLMPFIRALIHMVWSEEPFGGSIILRHDSPLSSLLRLILKFYCGDYLSYMEAEIKSIIEESNDFIREMPISNNEDALAFIDHVFNPEINLFFGSVDHKMSSTLRSIIRVVFIRTAGFYINQHAPYLVIPNLMLLRFLLPHMTTKISLAFPSGSKVQSISKLAASSFLSLFYRNGWTSDPFLSKFGKFMEKYYYESVRFAIHVIDCHKWEFENTDTYLDDKWDLIDLLGDAANNLILMNMKSPNKILNTHIYSISIMQMIEEYTYDFSILSTESWKKDQFI
ncbi:hypothetical protein GPJ56_007102 [Histomonas meleagridis]|uniref:uncharacterized protein n=1 Tax=Histomonas meleagridis TaxID=135588 RepID=UPI003559DCE0|nr:hypothetical protein GPJ56_007102 [Histomonas meleagridis]KAH0796103.1 hypothetical protein GO595_011070 [Histomonas meleagridis]